MLIKRMWNESFSSRKNIIWVIKKQTRALVDIPPVSRVELFSCTEHTKGKVKGLNDPSCQHHREGKNIFPLLCLLLSREFISIHNANKHDVDLNVDSAARNGFHRVHRHKGWWSANVRNLFNYKNPPSVTFHNTKVFPRKQEAAWKRVHNVRKQNDSRGWRVNGHSTFTRWKQ